MWRTRPSRLTFQSAERLRQRNLRIGPVQQQQIDLAQAQPHQAIARGALQRPRRKMRRPDFGGDEEFVALDAGGADAVADVALVVVHFRGVDVAIAKPQRLLDGPGAAAPAQFPGAEPDQRNFGAVGLDAGDWSNRCHVSLRARLAQLSGRKPADERDPGLRAGAVRVRRQRALPSTAKAASGACSMTLSNARAGPRGERLPCSQLRTVSTGTPIRAAKAAWVKPVRLRILRA